MGEEVQIDSLQIEILTKSTNAAKGIDDFATSLGKLKSNGSFKTVSTNLNHLSEALNKLPNVHGASNSLRTLANSIEKLKGVGTVSSLVNSLNKLPGALKSLDSINLGNAESNVRGLVDAISPLTQVKNSGFSSMVNSMAKLKSVTESLDTATLDKFAEKVKRLNEIVEPFATKMGTIKTALGGINTQIKQTNVSIDQVNEKVNIGIFNVSNWMNVFSHLQGVLQGVIQTFAEFIHQASEWDGIAARFGRGFGAQAQETYEWIQRLNEEMGINIQQFMQYSSVYATMLTGFGVANEDAAKMALGYTELTYDIWAGYNDIYKSFDEAAEAVRSAIAGEVEPVRRAGFTIIESTLEQTAANHGLEISIENATEAQKSYLRYLTLVDQAHAQGLVGTYAKEMNTAEGLMRTLTQQIKSLTQAFGSLFIPILVKVLPWVQAFVELLKEGVYWLANLLGVEIQKVDFSGYDAGAGAIENVANSAGTASDALEDATKAAKELKNATLGIDELNVISPPKASSNDGGSGGAGGTGSDGFSGLDVDSLWDETIFDTIQSDVDAIKEKMRGLLPVVAGIATALGGWKLTNLLKDLDDVNPKLLGLSKGITVAGIAITVGKLVWDFTGAYLEGGDEADLLKALGTTTIGVALAGWLAGKPGASFTLLTSGVVTLTKLGIEIAEGTVEWNDTESLVTMLVGGLETAIGAVFTWKTISPMVKKAWPKIAETAAPVLAKAGPYGWIAAAVVGGITLALVDYDFTEIGKKIGEKVGEAVGVGWKFIKEGIKTAWEWAVDSLEIDDLWDVLAVLFIPGEWERRITPELELIFENVSEWLNDKIENLEGNINEFFDGFFDGFFEGLGVDMSWADNFAEIFDIQYLDIVDMVMNPSSIGKHIMTGIVNAMDKNTKTAALKDKLSAMWTTAKNWWDKSKGTLKSYVPSIGSIKDKLSSAWTTAKNWWNKNRSSLSYTPSIGNIKNKLSSAWTTAKNWWNRSRSSLSYTPSIGSIRDKIKSAWNTAKSWWNKNVKLSTKLDIKVPKISVKWKEVEAFGKTFKYPTGFDLKFAANGGIFDQGSLIWAGERGPEVMATAAGGKTGVMNVQQMQDAVYEGVYAAVSAAMRGMGGGGEQSVNVYLDGRQITASVEKRQRERGASIMGNEVYAY